MVRAMKSECDVMELLNRKDVSYLCAMWNCVFRELTLFIDVELCNFGPFFGVLGSWDPKSPLRWTGETHAEDMATFVQVPSLAFFFGLSAEGLEASKEGPLH